MKLHQCIILLWFAGTLLIPADEPKKTMDIAALQSAADRGDAEAQYQLGRALFCGEGLPKDLPKAFDHFKAAADHGHAEAMGWVGYCYSMGIVVTKDGKQATEWFRRGAEKGSTMAQLNLGKSLIEGKNLNDKEKDPVRDEGIQWIKKAADQGLPEAALSYGKMVYLGHYGLPQDYPVVAGYIKIAAAKENPEAENLLGTMLQYGQGLPVDLAGASQWFRMAALQDYARAQCNLGRLLGPENTNKNIRIEALAWLIISSDQDDTFARKTLDEALPTAKKGEYEEAKLKALELRKLVKAQEP